MAAVARHLERDYGMDQVLQMEELAQRPVHMVMEGLARVAADLSTFIIPRDKGRITGCLLESVLGFVAASGPLGPTPAARAG